MTEVAKHVIGVFLFAVARDVQRNLPVIGPNPEAKQFLFAVAGDVQ